MLQWFIPATSRDLLKCPLLPVRGGPFSQTWEVVKAGPLGFAELL